MNLTIYLTYWHHDMKMFSILLAFVRWICIVVTSGFSSQSAICAEFGVDFEQANEQTVKLSII